MMIPVPGDQKADCYILDTDDTYTIERLATKGDLQAEDAIHSTTTQWRRRRPIECLVGSSGPAFSSCACVTGMVLCRTL